MVEEVLGTAVVEQGVVVLGAAVVEVVEEERTGKLAPEARAP